MAAGAHKERLGDRGAPKRRRKVVGEEIRLAGGRHEDELERRLEEQKPTAEETEQVAVERALVALVNDQMREAAEERACVLRRGCRQAHQVSGRHVPKPRLLRFLTDAVAHPQADEARHVSSHRLAALVECMRGDPSGLRDHHARATLGRLQKHQRNP